MISFFLLYLKKKNRFINAYFIDKMNKINKKISLLFRNLTSHKLFCFSKVIKAKLKKPQEEEKTHERVVSNYLNDINENSTDFKQEFGFVDSIKDAHQQYKRNERKINIYFTIFFGLACTGG